MKGDPVYSGLSKMVREADDNTNKSPSKGRQRTKNNLQSQLSNQSPSRYDGDQENVLMKTQKSQPPERDRSDSNKKQSKFHQSEY